MKRIYALWLAIALSICLMGSSNSDEGKDAGDHYQGHDESSRFYSSGYNPLNIPVGHYPASGECRIWYPDLFPGKQPPPGDRESLRRTVPPGALLILHPENDPSHVHVIAYDELRPCIVRPVREFEIKSGVLVRIILDR